MADVKVGQQLGDSCTLSGDRLLATGVLPQDRRDTDLDRHERFPPPLESAARSAKPAGQLSASISTFPGQVSFRRRCDRDLLLADLAVDDAVRAELGAVRVTGGNEYVVGRSEDT